MASMAESVWDYPRPPKLEPSPREVTVVNEGVRIARSTGALRILETPHPPVYSLPPTDVRTELLIPTTRHTFCEFKGVAHYADLVLPGARVSNVAWYYPEPAEGYQEIAGF